MICKGPDESYFHAIDWTNDLGADTISGSSVTVQAGITLDSDGNDAAQESSFDLSGGTAGTTYEIVAQINSAGGDIFKRYIYCKVQNQILG